MKKYTFLVFFGFCNNLKAQDKDCFIGFWANKKETQIIEIYKSDSSYYGKIYYLKDIEEKDIDNKIVIIQMKNRDNKILYGGTYLDSISKEEYEIKLKLINKNTIKFIGYNGFFNKTMLWHKVERG